MPRSGVINDYFSFAFQNWRSLAFGSILIALSSFGQTYYISLFGTGFRATFRLSDGGLGALYGASTVLSALTLTWAGRLIDHTTVRRYTWCVAALLAAACVLAAIAPFGWVLAVCFYLLRLGGQGLMMHTALTCTGRRFPEDAGKALGIIMLGFAFAQAVFPELAVLGIDIIGWRAVWVVGAAVVLGGVAIATTLIPPAEDSEGVNPGQRPEPMAALWRDPRMHLALPVVLASPFIGTGFFFHQARLAQEKGWPLSWLAGWFVAYAIVQATTNIAAGPIIDHIRPKRVLPIFLIPQAGAMLALSLSDSIWVAPIYLVLTGITSAIAGTLATALWVELYGPDMLARVRSTVEAGLIVASGAAPLVMGYLLDLGVPLRIQALGCLIYIALASAFAVRISRMPAPFADVTG
jgi:MFS family permease